MEDMTGTQIEIAAVCDDVKELLLYKNSKYVCLDKLLQYKYL